MRMMFVLIVMVMAAGLKAQATWPGSSLNSSYGSGFMYDKNFYDSTAQKKWFISRYTGISTSYSFFKGGSAAMVAVPVGLQLNRRLNNNLYAFANVSAAPAYINFSQAFITTDINKVNAGNGFYKPGNVGIYSSASLGLMYMNNEKTFSVSGSISIERSGYPAYYYNGANTTKPKSVMPSYR